MLFSLDRRRANAAPQAVPQIASLILLPLPVNADQCSRPENIIVTYRTYDESKKARRMRLKDPAPSSSLPAQKSL